MLLSVIKHGLVCALWSVDVMTPSGLPCVMLLLEHLTFAAALIPVAQFNILETLKILSLLRGG